VSFRPLDWAPLAQADPLPGDPEEIRYEARRLSQMAAQLQGQVTTLRRVGAAETLVGTYAEELRASAEEVAKKLDLVHERYATVSGYLKQWADELENFQRSTLKALDKALDAERMTQRDPHVDLPVQNWYSYQTSPLSPLADTTGPAAALLAEARHDLWRVLEDALARDRHWGSLIGDAIDDKLTDHWRDHLHHWVERNHRWLKDLSTGLGWATTIAAFGAMAFPPAGAVLGVAILTMSATNLAIHGTEAVGGEKGALFEAGLDIVGVASFGAGKLVSRGLEGTFEATRGAAAAAASGEAAAGVRAAESTTIESANAVLRAETSTVLEKRTAARLLNSIEQRAIQAGDDAARTVVETPTAPVGLWKAVAAGSREDAHLINDTRLLATAYHGDAAVQDAASGLRALTLAGRANWMPATALDLGDKTARYMPYAGAYKRFEDRWVLSGGDF
jgi:hypothetical protein